MLGRPPCRVDLISSIDGVTYREAWSGRLPVNLAGIPVAVLGLRELIANKRAAGRPKDLADLALLEEVREQDRAVGSRRPSPLRKRKPKKRT